MRMKRLTITALLLTGLMATAKTGKDATEAETGGRPESVAKSLRETYNRIGNVDIYGKLVDQEDNVVAGADVHLSWYSAKWMVTGGGRKQHNDWIKTDKDGRFEIKLDHPE